MSAEESRFLSCLGKRIGFALAVGVLGVVLILAVAYWHVATMNDELRLISAAVSAHVGHDEGDSCNPGLK